jgi:hypothetical protein
LRGQQLRARAPSPARTGRVQLPFGGHVGMVVHAAYVKLNDYVCVCRPNCPNVSYITTKCPALLILCKHEGGGVGLPSAVFETTDTFARPNAQVT